MSLAKSRSQVPGVLRERGSFWQYSAPGTGTELSCKSDPSRDCGLLQKKMKSIMFGQVKGKERKEKGCMDNQLSRIVVCIGLDICYPGLGKYWYPGNSHGEWYLDRAPFGRRGGVEMRSRAQKVRHTFDGESRLGDWNI
eukprot:1160720-Pelagomonas_calceolata.AAC.22